MLFNSYFFIGVFFPLAVAGYFLAHRYLGAKAALCVLIAASLVFMAWWQTAFAAVLIVSVLFNYGFGSALTLWDKTGLKRWIFIAAIATNILFLGYFKYTNFLLENIALFWTADIRPLALLLPIGISFYTFMQIAWLTDIYRHGGYRYDFLSYATYVTFFPYVVSGPIAYHREIIPQMESKSVRTFRVENLCAGLFLFSIGLFKKTAIADTLAIVAEGGFGAATALTFTEAWLTSLSYTMQLYFDFSGYTDMAIGCAIILNIRIPANFNSPYKALDIRDFWRRWHITLSRFLRDYIYIPLGGSRHGDTRLYFSLLLTFLIGGLWHGAAWTFVFWGFLHGAALCVHRLWMKTGMRLPKVLAWLITFNFINIAWVFFRADDWKSAIAILKGMAGLNGILLSPNLAESPFWQKLAVIGVGFGPWRDNLPAADSTVYFLCIALIPFVLIFKNSNELAQSFKPGVLWALAVSLMLVIGLLLINNTSSFLYFNF